MKFSKSCCTGLVLTFGMGLAAGAASSSSGYAGNPSPVAGLASLDLAFRFASAIRSDPKDQAKAQEAVLRDYLLLGADEEAATRAQQIQGWRRGVIYAQMAERKAQQGDEAAARDLIERAQSVRAESAGWEVTRVDAEIATALAALGDLDSSRHLAQDLAAADPRQYAGRSAATLAQGEAALGNFDKSMEALGQVNGETDVEIAGARTSGYLELARAKRFSKAQRLQALEAAESSTANLPSWEQVDALSEASQLYREAGQDNRSISALKKAEEIARSLPGSATGKIPLMAGVAQGWARLGDKTRARSLLRQAEPAIANALDIDRPAAYARLASAWRAVGDSKQSDRLMTLAIATAESLANARPRALSAVDICRSLGRDGVEPDSSTRGRLESLLANLKDPW